MSLTLVYEGLPEPLLGLVVFPAILSPSIHSSYLHTSKYKKATQYYT